MTAQPDREQDPTSAARDPAEVVLRPDNDVAEVFDGELVDNRKEIEREPPLLIARRISAAPARWVITRLPDKSRVGRAGAACIRTGWMIGRGGASWAHRAASAATHGILREQIRAARIAGDGPLVGALTKELRERQESRHELIRNLPRTLLGAAAAAGIVCAVLLLGVGVGGGLYAQLNDGGYDWASWWALGGKIAAWAGAIVKVAVVAAFWASVPLAVWAAWREGYRVADPPRWLAPAGLRDQRDTTVTPSLLVVALRDLGISELRKQIKEMADAAAGMCGLITIAGCGVEVDVSLPSGISTKDIRDRRQRLAENLLRHEHELYITIPKTPRTVRLWIADPGALDEPIGPSPLVLGDDVDADYYTGRAPWGESLRGDPVHVSLKQRHLLITGMSNQGKTASLRALALWLAFDTTVEFRLADLKGIGDWHMLAPLTSQPPIEGPSDEHVIAATEMLEDGVAEMERRMTALDPDKYPDGVTRKLARQPGSGFHPLILIVDEAQVAYMCPIKDEQGRPYGGRSSRSRFFLAARKLHNQGRAVNVLLWQGTQDPTNDNLPKLVREGAHIRISLVVGTESQAKMALGDAAVDGGAAPHLLRKDIDKGMVVMDGGVDIPRGESSLTVRTHFIDGTAATDLAARALDRRSRSRRHLHVVEPDSEPDHVAAIGEAMRGESRVRTAVLLGRLIEADPDLYEPWGHQQLAATLREVDVPIRPSNGQSVVRLEDIQRALSERPVN